MRSEAAWQRLAAELGRVYGELLAVQAAISELEAELERVRRQPGDPRPAQHGEEQP